MSTKTKTLNHHRPIATNIISIENYYGGELFLHKPKRKKHPTPIFYVPGFSSNPNMAIKAIKKIAKDTGREVISYFPEPGTLILNDDVVKGWDPMQVHNAVELVSAIIQSGYEGVDIVGHSQGALSATLAAQIDPPLIRNLVLVAPAGFMQAKSHLDSLRDMYRNTLQYRSLYKKGNLFIKTMLKNFLRYVFKYKMKAWHEALSAADQRITPGDLARLSEDGSQVALILCNDDKLFPYELISNSIPETISVSIDKDNKKHPTYHSSILFDEEMINTVIANLKSFK